MEKTLTPYKHLFFICFQVCLPFLLKDFQFLRCQNVCLLMSLSLSSQDRVLDGMTGSSRPGPSPASCEGCSSWSRSRLPLSPTFCWGLEQGRCQYRAMAPQQRSPSFLLEAPRHHPGADPACPRSEKVGFGFLPSLWGREAVSGISSPSWSLPRCQKV